MTASPYTPAAATTAGEFDKVVVVTENDYSVQTATVTVWAESAPEATSKAMRLVDRKLARLGLINCLERSEGTNHGDGVYTLVFN